MDWSQVEGNWRQLKGSAKAQWGKLTDADLMQIEGRREQLEGKIQERYGYTKERVRKELDDWYRSVTTICEKAVGIYLAKSTLFALSSKPNFLGCPFGEQTNRASSRHSRRGSSAS